jgi:biopolymer transport protein ExbD
MKKGILLILIIVWTYNQPKVLGQSIELPSISSQYLTQGNDYGAARIQLSYQSNQVNMLLGDEVVLFTQKNLYQYLDKRYATLQKERIRQENIKIEAPKQLPVHYLGDVYTWIQIYGCKNIHFALYEEMDLDKIKYLPLDVLVFPPMETACLYYAQKNKTAQTAIATLNAIHPQTKLLQTDISKTLKIEAKEVRPIHYVPQNMVPILIKPNSVVEYNGQQINTMVLGSMIQNKLIEHYGSSHQKAKPEAFLWLYLQFDKDIRYQQYLEVLLALQEAFHLYWEELAYNKYQNAYLELDVQQQWNIRQAAPKLICQYDIVQLLYIRDKLSEGSPKVWTDL